jgi:hypothetical protein
MGKGQIYRPTKLRNARAFHLIYPAKVPIIAT